ncbi:alpha-tubulin [Reticulomyxa filosa]|uniref:Alpha-tubulin n=1 Tax=Reticulomyxa filosa TaxID=46433 RepID=X6LGG5_RETFI|nr:alpha-tubulin [Reticulomyxa filosa]|eukprot:ETO00679.1 alpha-tubulin [Reticulomyxa filosa]
MDFFIGHSVGGGTGSVLGALILERLAVDYRKKPKIGFDVYGICQKQLRIAKPDVGNLNKLISKVISAMTSSLRFRGELNVDLNEFQTNLVPFPPDVSIAPNDVQKITDDCFKPANWFVKYTEFDPAEDKYMAISLNYRGDIKSKEANATVQWLKSNNKVALAEWCPTGFKIGLNEVPAVTLESDDIGAFSKNAIMISNNTVISRVFSKRIT